MKIRLLKNTNDTEMMDMMNGDGVLMGSIHVESFSSDIQRDIYNAYNLTGDDELELSLEVSE